MIGFQTKAKNHWRKHLPRLTKALEETNQFEAETKLAAERAMKELLSLVRNGGQLEAAKEIVLKEYILLPPETTE